MNNAVKEEHWLETYRSLITLSLEGFRYLALINGGAVVALLAYLGDAGGRLAPRLGCAFLGFLAGLALCGLGLFAGYVTQLWLLSEGGSVREFYKSHRLPLYLGMVLYLASIAAFSVGSWSAVSAFEVADAAQQAPSADAATPRS